MMHAAIKNWDMSNKKLEFAIVAGLNALHCFSRQKSIREINQILLFN